ncbi:MAG: 3-phosphoshikimate 1-carboxyvinyltransferase [Prevotellaceae bacterium]|jgi:3-phosphoshikimate 1-carboxyvinyltransferase|nr:3-phosphoshikimate 1-carboxyvinyltransferase [Prevotellaceae bacterium]
MIYSVFSPNNKEINATVQLPASKSISNRALIIHALSYADGQIHNLADCDDTGVLVKALHSNAHIFDIGAAGTAMRFLTAFLSKIIGEWIITGSERMKQRPISILVDALNKLGAHIEYEEKEGFPPLRIHGSALQGGEIELDGSVSSQYISALLMIAPTMRDGLTLKLTGKTISKPYIYLTLKLMEDFGVKASWTDNTITILPQEYKPADYTVESDWSAASYWYQLCALSQKSEIKLLGLHKNSCQGDAKVAEIFASLGVRTKFQKNEVILTKSNELTNKLIYNFTDQPDLAQTVVVTCCFLQIPFRFSGLQSLKIKETNRVEALQNECRKLGFILEEPAGGILEWNGKRCEADSTPVIKTYEDHRMAMAFAPVCLKTGEIQIENPMVVTKSYPNYWEDLRVAGMVVIENLT